MLKSVSGLPSSANSISSSRRNTVFTAKMMGIAPRPEKEVLFEMKVLEDFKNRYLKQMEEISANPDLVLE